MLLKRAYKYLLKALIRNNINYITKILFLLFLVTTYKVAIIKSNILEDF
jgi:hypothetical protein